MKFQTIRKYKNICLGIFDYLLDKKNKNTFEGPLNNQKIRQDIFKELIEKIPFDTVIETGTFLGNTSEYLHKTTLLPIHTIENNSRKFGYAKARLLKFSSVKIYLGNSPKLLNDICKRFNLKEKTIFFYLDAHTKKESPIIEELKIITQNYESYVIMIDDFFVNPIPEYNYNYTGNNKLDIEYINQVLRNEFKFFFPSVSPDFETGKKRGYVLLSKNQDFTNILQSINNLQEFRIL